MSVISFFSSMDALTTQSYPLDLYLSHIQDGAFREQVEQARQELNKDQPQSLPVVTLSGLFKINKEGLSLTQHSGFIALDVEGFQDLERGKVILSQDRYTYAVFENHSGKSLTALVRIAACEHGQAYQALSAYYEGVYGIITDPMDQLVTKLRYVTYDPFLSGNPEAETFKVRI
ncbi:BT4734/BF3469 family protein [Xanthocytophaga agilis]|uniref:BT4734/BF3469 family protein n=1 Tax=Xanthocytophaga agilis TaxID=3048010 RepID=A0AAE3R5D4_9BACT|nr:BT4734/BF3469 family protein [Xanthocytophaga agilis]MDJ1503525.1 BT4734/BF3469 family protein [Xanthocytophaga agilis]